jgi:hypothetical protein
MVLMRPGACTNDHISYQTGNAGERYMNVELGVFRPNIPLDPQQGPMPRQQKKGSALQEYFEQLMMCKCKQGMGCTNAVKLYAL